MSMDLTESIVPRSDQINADELVGGPATYTIREVRKGVAESPFDFLLVETDRAYRPSKTMRRVIVNAWGPEAANYAGRRLTLYREPSIKFGGAVVGGIRISAMSHIDKRVEVMAQVTRGKRETFAVDPLPDAAPTSPVVSLELLDELLDMFRRKGIPEATRLSGANHITGGSATDLECLTDAEARQVLAALESHPDVEAAS